MEKGSRPRSMVGCKGSSGSGSSAETRRSVSRETGRDVGEGHAKQKEQRVGGGNGLRGREKGECGARRSARGRARSTRRHLAVAQTPSGLSSVCPFKGQRRQQFPFHGWSGRVMTQQTLHGGARGPCNRHFSSSSVAPGPSSAPGGDGEKQRLARAPRPLVAAPTSAPPASSDRAGLRASVAWGRAWRSPRVQARTWH